MVDLNSIIATSFTLVIAGAVTGGIIGIGFYVKEIVKKIFYSSIVIENQDPMYNILLNWIMSQNLENKISNLNA
jgi:predicted membrane protein